MGRKLPFAATNTNNTPKHSSSTETLKTNECHQNSSSSSSSSSSGVKKPPELRIRPRFAPEFDGVNCFETIVPY
ncbi:hypothetical protein HanXRQr2_Chr08g0340191 [Helianthus annuus]|uniref:Uncharacterized protein n=1 Tax=Helianthus annuus TaxID=4232 RepID=A0A9K3NCR2_HELAN|nr:hypothetical protein HanXRQr2_Chr08g0340191 [Helianthus annuus]KAJ0901717.1 hypothetical protein HanPSC8_Chr08g0328571 [Helianthus annuus]